MNNMSTLNLPAFIALIFVGLLQGCSGHSGTGKWVSNNDTTAQDDIILQLRVLKEGVQAELIDNNTLVARFIRQR